MKVGDLLYYCSAPDEDFESCLGLATALEEINDPIFAKMGWQRAVGMATTLTTIPPLAVWGFMQAYGFTEKKLDALREF